MKSFQTTNNAAASSVASVKTHKTNAFLSVALLLGLGILNVGIFTGAASATQPPHKPEPQPTAPAPSTPVIVAPVGIAAPSANSTAGAAAISGSHSLSGSQSTSGAQSTIDSNATTTSGSASTVSGDASSTSGSASTIGGTATTAAGAVTNVLRTGDNSFLYLPNPATHPNVNITAGSYVYGGRVYVVCPTRASSWHITAYVLGAGMSETSDEMPQACGPLVASAQRIDALGGLLSLLQYMDGALRTAYVTSAADRMLEIIGATAVRLPAGGSSSTSSQHQSSQTRVIIIRRGEPVPASN